MTSTGFDSYSWFNIDICIPPVEEDEMLRNNVPHSTENVQHAAAEHIKKPSATPTSGPSLQEPTMMKHEMKVPLSPFEYVTERPPVRLARPKAPEKKNSSQPANEPSAQTHVPCDASECNDCAASEAESSSTDSVISNDAQYMDKGVYSPYQGLFLLIALLFTLLAAPIFALLNKIRESRRAHYSWNDMEEQY